MSERSEFAIFRALIIRMIVRIYVNIYKVIFPTNKSLQNASDLIRTPLRSRLWGVTERGFKGEADEDPCGRGLGPPPLYEDSTVNKIE